MRTRRDRALWPVTMKNSIAMIHSIDADIGQDIYCMCNEPDAQPEASPDR
jgi:hypothetical protein